MLDHPDGLSIGQTASALSLRSYKPLSRCISVSSGDSVYLKCDTNGYFVMLGKSSTKEMSEVVISWANYTDVNWHCGVSGGENAQHWLRTLVRQSAWMCRLIQPQAYLSTTFLVVSASVADLGCFYVRGHQVATFTTEGPSICPICTKRQPFIHICFYKNSIKVELHIPIPNFDEDTGSVWSWKQFLSTTFYYNGTADIAMYTMQYYTCQKLIPATSLVQRGVFCFKLTLYHSAELYLQYLISAFYHLKNEQPTMHSIMILLKHKPFHLDGPTPCLCWQWIGNTQKVLLTNLAMFQISPFFSPFWWIKNCAKC